MQNRKGFTLIELLIVVLIIGILAAIALPQYQTAITRTKFAEMQLTINALAKDFETYYLINGQYPGEEGVYGIDIKYPGCATSSTRLVCKNFDVDYYPAYMLLLAYSKNKQYGFTQWLQIGGSNKNKRACCAVEGTQYEQFCKKTSKTGEIIYVMTGNLINSAPCYEYN